MPKRYLFFYRNNSDTDHLSPVIYGLIKNGVDVGGYQKFYKDNIEPTDSSLNVYANYLMKD